MTDELTPFQRKLAERRKAQEEATKAQNGFTDTVPEEQFERSPEDAELDRIIDGIDILDAYNRWCGKMVPEVRAGQTEGIKISCPIPGHRDSNPSAWLNTEKQTWFCATCSVGGDAYDIAAFHFNYPVPGYKNGPRFHDLRRDMAKSYGYTFIKPPGVKTPIAVPPPRESGPPDSGDSGDGPGDEPETGSSEKLGESDDDNVVSLHEEDDEPEVIFPHLEWRDLVTADSFLDIYMQCCALDDVPEEYHFWNGLLALGAAVGRDVTLYDTVPVYANLFLCLLGNTGDGKSRSFAHLSRLLAKALPPKWDNPNDKGVWVFGAPASAEYLIQSFSKPIPDPTNPKVTAYYAPVRGVVSFNELAQLVGRGQRQGNVLKPTLMEFYDGFPVITTGSMTTGKKEAHEPFASCFTTTQPKSLKELVTAGDAGSGFLNRWVFASGRRKQRRAIGGVMVDIDPAVEPLKRVQTWAGFGKKIQWSAEGEEQFTEVFNSMIVPAQDKDSTDLLTRIDLTMKKLILLFCINDHSSEVTAEIVDKAARMFPYLVDSYGLPASQIGNRREYEVLEDIRKVIKKTKHKDGPTLRELNRNLEHKKHPISLMKTVLEYMVTMGELIPVESQGQRGPKTVRYRYVG